MYWIMESIVRCFLPKMTLVSYKPLGEGLINNTYLVEGSESNQKYVLQRVNSNVFTSPEIISDNIGFFTSHVLKNAIDYPFLHFLKTQEDCLFYRDEDDKYWRMYQYVTDTYTNNKMQHAEEAAITAFQFGRFTAAFNGLDLSIIRPSIPDFHNLTLRYEHFLESTLKASKERLSNAAAEVTFLLKRAFLVDRYEQIRNATDIPLRLIHADAKIGNILFNKSDNKPCCVIDYDTVMPGYFFSDLGDMVRTMCCTCDENETDLSKLSFRKDYYEALVSGYLKAVALTNGEKELIDFSGLFMTYMQALRFLTDYLNNDIYYAVSYKEHNLSRVKNQCRLLELMESELS